MDETTRKESLTRIEQAIANNWPISEADARWMHSEITRLDAEKEALADAPDDAEKPAARRKAKS